MENLKEQIKKAKFRIMVEDNKSFEDLFEEEFQEYLETKEEVSYGQLDYLQDYYNIKTKKIEDLKNSILQYMNEILLYMPYQEFQFLSKMIKHIGANQRNFLIEKCYSYYAENLEISFLVKSEEGLYDKYYIPVEFVDKIRSIITEQDFIEKRKKVDQVSIYIRGIIALYGVIEEQAFANKVLYSVNVRRALLQDEDLIQKVIDSDSNISMISYRNRIYILDVLFCNDSALEIIRKRIDFLDKANIDYKSISSFKIIEYGKYRNLIWTENNEEILQLLVANKTLLAIDTKLLVESVYQIQELIDLAQINDMNESVIQIMQILELNDVTIGNIENANRILNTYIMKLMNQTRNLLNRGYSASELSKR